MVNIKYMKIHSLNYLADLSVELHKQWPENRLLNIVCHGHSVPAGYFATPRVEASNAYPHLLHRMLLERFPYAVINVIVTAIGGESSVSGAERFSKEVLNHTPSVVTIDYALNDRGHGLVVAGIAWRSMIEEALAFGSKVILCTPTPDMSSEYGETESWQQLQQHAEQIRQLAVEYQVALADSLLAFEKAVAAGEYLTNLLSWYNHPSGRGHQLVADEIARWFIA